jgi:hypothetical protein
MEATLSLQYSKQLYYLREERNMYRGDAVRTIVIRNKSRLNTALQPDKELFNIIQCLHQPTARRDECGCGGEIISPKVPYSTSICAAQLIYDDTQNSS